MTSDAAEFFWEGQPKEYWIQALSASDDETRWKAVDALRHIAHPSQTIPLFVMALNDHYWRVRALAAHALYDMAHEEESTRLLVQHAVIPLADALSNASAEVRLSAAYALDAIGPRAVAALPQLRKAVESDEVQLREAATVAIRSLGNC